MNATTAEETQILELAEIAPATPPATLPAISENSPMAMMLAAQRQGASLADIREMMAIQREYEAAEAKKAFDESFAAFRGENIIIPKTKHVDRGRGGSFDQAEYDGVCGRLSPALSRHGFGFRHDQKFGAKRWMTEGVENDEPWVWVTCYLTHRKGHSEKLELEGPPGDLSVNTPTQNMQTTASYLKRQSLLAITGTATGGEDDEARLRQKRDSDAGNQGGAEDETVLQAGRDAAMEGMEKLTAWWGGLTAKDRSRLNREFGDLRKAAAKADAGGPQQ
jgi:hypothetical protein